MIATRDPTGGLSAPASRTLVPGSGGPNWAWAEADSSAARQRASTPGLLREPNKRPEKAAEKRFIAKRRTSAEIVMNGVPGYRISRNTVDRNHALKSAQPTGSADLRQCQKLHPISENALKAITLPLRHPLLPLVVGDQRADHDHDANDSKNHLHSAFSIARLGTCGAADAWSAPRNQARTPAVRQTDFAPSLQDSG